MSSINPELIQLGAIAIIFLFFLKEFFSYLKSRKNGNNKKDSSQDVKIAVIETKITEIAENHLPHIEERLDNIDGKLEDLLKR